VRWQPAPGRVLNASYRYNRQQVDPTGATSQLKQVDFSGQWPFLDNWSAIGRWNYSLVDSQDPGGRRRASSTMAGAGRFELSVSG
jgi:lipopolysaccharide assembly outer membrane protein LptD (OstA)